MTKARTLADNFAADINGITAGTGITGGGTSGTVTVTNSMATEIDAKGDLVVGTGADTFARLAVASTAGYLLSVDSAEATGLKWAAPASGGKVLQVVQGTYGTETSSSSNTYADTGLSVSITPASTSSKVLCIFAIAAGKDNQNSTNQCQIRIVRGSTGIWATGGGAYTETSLKNYIPFAGSYLDSPSTTSSTTYKLQFRNSQGNNAAVYTCIGNETGTLILMEIGA